MYATNLGEFRLNKKNGGKWIYDFTDTINKKIIEYNGDMYHANPSKYLSDDNPHPFRKELKSHEIWKKDREKISVAKENGFDVLIVWDSEIRSVSKQKREEIIKKCIEFLNK